MKASYLNRILFYFILLVSGCAYFNTFYNAQNYYREAKKGVTHDTLKVDSEFFEKAIEKATVVIVKYPTCRWVDDALFMMGAAYYYKGDYNRALEKLDFFCLNYPKSRFYVDALYYKGLSYYKQQKLGPATIALKEAAGSKYYRRKALHALCYVYNKDGNYASLIEVAKQLLKESLGAMEKRSVYYLLGDAQFNQKSYTEALKTYNTLIDITHDEAEKRNLKLKIAKIYLEVGEYELCRTFLANEQDIEFKNLLADLMVRIGDTEKAMGLYLEVANNASDFTAEAYYKLAGLYKDQDSLELAIAYYDSAINKSYTDDLRNKAQKKAAVLQRIVGLTKDTLNLDRAQFLLAEIYYVDLDEPTKALNEYRKVSEEFPKSEWAARALYAEFWINKNYLANDSVAGLLAQQLLSKYPNSDYAMSIKKIIAEEKIEK